MTTHQFEENCEILEGICEEYGLKVGRGHYVAVVFVYVCSSYPLLSEDKLWFDDEDLSNPNWDSIRERVCSFSLEFRFS